MTVDTVLLVDDEPVVLQIHAAAVRQFGFEALMAESASEGVYLVRKYKPSLIISDVQMPGEGGFDFVKMLVDEDLKAMPVIYLTGYDDIEIVRGGLRAGGDDFLIKGVQATVIKQRIAFWMASGFKMLPVDVRRRALKAANTVAGDTFPGLVQHYSRQNDFIGRVQSRLQMELEAVSDTYGERLIERVCFMARLSKILIEESREFDDFLRFPDGMLTVTKNVGWKWSDAMTPLFAHFDEWSNDRRFGEAGFQTLEEIQHFNW